ncbi:MAG: NAD-dependent epimerase/dehydratase family protein [Spirochaetales bacterium]
MERILVIGGNGFLGAALLRGLLEAGYSALTSFDLTPGGEPGVRSLAGDLRNAEQVRAACEGIDTVFQTAALVDWGPRSRERLYAINVLGNRNVIEACQAQGVARLVYTSSIDVVFDGHDIAGGDESLPIPTRHLDDYGHTKALAEAEVLAASTASGLQTCALRAAGIYGPGDRHRFPPILKAVRGGQMMYLGDGQARFNHVYITNLVQAHLQSAESLLPGSAVSGRAFFVTDHEPGNFYEFFTPFLTALDLPVPSRRLPAGLAYALAVVMEGLARWFGGAAPLLTRYVVRSTCRDFWFVTHGAEQAFGYRPRVTRDEAFSQTLDWLRQNSEG